MYWFKCLTCDHEVMSHDDDGCLFCNCPVLVNEGEDPDRLEEIRLKEEGDYFRP